MNADRVEEQIGEQSLLLRDRKHLELHGVSEVISFDENTVELNTTCGGLVVEGQDLHVSLLNLEKGTVILDGTVDAASFTDLKSVNGKSGFFSRLRG